MFDSIDRTLQILNSEPPAHSSTLSDLVSAARAWISQDLASARAACPSFAHVMFSQRDLDGWPDQRVLAFVNRWYPGGGGAFGCDHVAGALSPARVE